MRSRNIKPNLFKNEILGVEDPYLTIVFVGLWCAADKRGRLEDRPLRLKAEILPYREGIDFNGYLTELSRLGFIHRYESDGVKVIEVINFKKHQNPHHTEKESELPEYIEETGSCEITVNTPLDTGDAPADSLLLIPDSLIPDSHEKPTPKKVKKEKFDVISFRPEWITEEDWKDIVIHRREHKSKPPETKRAYSGIVNQLNKAVENGHSLEDCIEKWLTRGWLSFDAEYMENGNGVQKTKKDCSLCDYKARGKCDKNDPKCTAFIPRSI